MWLCTQCRRRSTTLRVRQIIIPALILRVSFCILSANSLTDQFSSLRVSCDGIRQRFRRQLQLDFTYTLRIQWYRRHPDQVSGEAQSKFRTRAITYVEWLCTCGQWSPTFIISRWSFRTTALAWPIRPQEDIGQAQWCEAANQWAPRGACLQ
jgi:hypothetical protein